MIESDIIKTEYAALMKFCKGDRKMILEIIEEYGPKMRQHFNEKQPEMVTSDELCSFLESITRQNTAL